MSPQEIASTAKQLTDPVGRSVYLAEVCSGNAELRCHVEALLSTGDEPETVELQTGDRWSSIERYFDQLRELPAAEQQQKLAAIADSGVRDEVASLLQYSGVSETLHGVVGGMAAYVTEGGLCKVLHARRLPSVRCRPA